MIYAKLDLNITCTAADFKQGQNAHYWLAGDHRDSTEENLHKTYPQVLIWNKIILYLTVIILKQEKHTLHVLPVCLPEEVCFWMCLLTSFTASTFLFFFKISMTYLDRASGTVGSIRKFRSMITSSVCPKAIHEKKLEEE